MPGWSSRPAAGLVQQGGHLAGEVAQLPVGCADTLGEADGLGAGDADGELLGAGAPRGDLADPAGVEGASGIDPQVDDPQQRDQGVDRGGALVGDVVAGGDQDPQGGPASSVRGRRSWVWSSGRAA
jgi:hypothetical protein